MVVAQGFKGAPHQFIPKMPGRRGRRDAHREPLPDAEVPGFPGYHIAQRQLAAGGRV
jgi:hypothetical protein